MHFNTNQHPGDTWDVNNVGEPVLCERGLNNRYTPISTTTTAATSSVSSVPAKPAFASSDALQSNELEDRIEELEQGVAEAAELLAKGAEALKDLLEKVEKLKRENRTLRQGGEEK
jgi:uncharacterized coiled-coil protein SlyX